MNTVEKLHELSERIDHLQYLAEWVTRETTHSDNTVSQTATLLTVISEEIREKVCEVVTEFEKFASVNVQ